MNTYLHSLEVGTWLYFRMTPPDPEGSVQNRQTDNRNLSVPTSGAVGSGCLVVGGRECEDHFQMLVGRGQLGIGGYLG
jgi:hypothetical protein